MSFDLSRVRFNQDSYAADLINYQIITSSSTALDWTRLKARSDYYGFYVTDNFTFNDQLIAKINTPGILVSLKLKADDYKVQG